MVALVSPTGKTMYRTITNRTAKNNKNIFVRKVFSFRNHTDRKTFVFCIETKLIIMKSFEFIFICLLNLEYLRTILEQLLYITLMWNI